MAPSGASVFTPVGDRGSCCAVAATAPASTNDAATPIRTIELMCTPGSVVTTRSIGGGCRSFNTRRRIPSRVRRRGLQRQRVELAAHLPLQGLVDQLMLLHARLAAEGLGDHR